MTPLVGVLAATPVFRGAHPEELAAVVSLFEQKRLVTRWHAPRPASVEIAPRRPRPPRTRAFGD